MRRIRCGFTLIELLTVIAIIAILAAILFPTLKMVGDRQRNTSCMSNMKSLWQALKLYRDDEQRVPPVLMGYAENPDGSYNTTGAGYVNADRIIHGYLYTRARVNDAEKYHCPFNLPAVKNVATIAHFPPRPAQWPTRPDGTSYWYITDGGTSLTTHCPTDAYGYIDCWRPPEVAMTSPLYRLPKLFYTWDSYDISPRLDSAGNLVRNGAQIVYDRRYSPDWTGNTGPQDLSTQLRYPNPQDDKTLVTFCTWHAAIGKMDKLAAINFAGQARMADATELFNHGPNYFNK